MFASAVAAVGVFGTFGVLATANMARSTPSARATAEFRRTGDSTSLRAATRAAARSHLWSPTRSSGGGIDGRGETAGCPNWQVAASPPRVGDLHEDFATFDRLFHLQHRVSEWSAPPAPAHPWFALGRRF